MASTVSTWISSFFNLALPLWTPRTNHPNFVDILRTQVQSTFDLDNLFIKRDRFSYCNGKLTLSCQKKKKNRPSTAAILRRPLYHTVSSSSIRLKFFTSCSSAPAWLPAAAAAPPPLAPRPWRGRSGWTRGRSQTGAGTRGCTRGRRTCPQTSPRAWRGPGCFFRQVSKAKIGRS